MRPEAACPYCGCELKRPPKRRAKCPHCGKPIVIRTKQALFPSHLLTEEQALAWDAFSPMRAIYGTTVDEYRKTYDELTRIFGTPAPPTDVVLSLLERLGYSGEPSKLAQAHVDQAMLVAKLGGDPLPRLQEAMRLRLELNYRPSPVIGGVRVQAAHACCEECKAQDGDEYTIGEALEKMPLPYAGCTRRIYGPYPYCICYYQSILKPPSEWGIQQQSVSIANEVPANPTRPWREVERAWAIRVLLVCTAVIIAAAIIAAVRG